MITERPDASIEDFRRLDVRVGTVLTAAPNPKAHHPAFVLRIDFGAGVGIKTSSAQITERYSPEELIGTQVVAILNLPPRHVAGVRSECLVLAAVCADSGTILLVPTRSVTNGASVS